MSVFKEWKEWEKYIIYLTSHPINILEIGIGNGESMKKIVDLFITNNNKSKYYGIDEWNTYGIKSKEIEKQANNNLLKLKKYKTNISLIKRDPVNVLKKFMSKNLYFDFIIINSQVYNKEILYYSVLAIELLSVHGYLLFNNYIRLDAFSIKDSIDSIISIYKDTLEILYVGNQILLQKYQKDAKEIIKVINDFNFIIDKYWVITKKMLSNTLVNSKELPELKPLYSEYEEKKVQENSIFKKLNLEYILYKYSSLDNIKNILLKKLKSLKLPKIQYDILYEEISSSLNHYAVFNLITREYFYMDQKQFTKLTINNDSINVIKKKNKYINSDFINLDITSYKDTLEIAEKYSKKYSKFTAKSILKYPDFSNQYNNLIFQTLLLRHVLEPNGVFVIVIENSNTFINDFLILLNNIFKNVYIYFLSNKIGRMTIRINSIGFLGINSELYTKLSDVLFYSQKNNLEISSLFNSNIKLYDDSIYKKDIDDLYIEINSYIEINRDILTKNIDKILNHQKQRTINDFTTFLKEKKEI